MTPTAARDLLHATGWTPDQLERLLDRALQVVAAPRTPSMPPRVELPADVAAWLAQHALSSRTTDTEES